MNFTKEQLQAIESRGSRILVSAAAGSGKTAVLVERIIRRILDEDHPVDIDRMLVMTFTKAAAAQMKDKIIGAIESESLKRPGDPHLIRQSALVHNARITTIHGFCLDVIRDHFQEIGLDPAFRVADEGECRLLKKSVIENVIENAYKEGNAGFLNMTECLAAGKSDSALEEILDKMYEFSMSYPDPYMWLQKCASVYEDVSEKSVNEQEWMKVILNNAKAVIRDASYRAQAAYDLSAATDGPYMYAPAVLQDIDLFEKLLECNDFEGYRNILSGISWTKLGREKKDGPYIDPDIREQVKNIRNEYKTSLNRLASGEFSEPLNEHLRRIKACAPIVSELVRLTEEIMLEYGALKRDKKVVDFADLEHLCIKILTARDGDTAGAYREYFEEIYVDEYQDSSLVQEELLNCISRDDNLFMVGDVKQSIYSFRLARPQLFMEKYKKAEQGEGLCRIDLTYNFRSRGSVLCSVNELFTRIMSSELGGIDYDDAAKLRAGAYYPETDTKKERTELHLIRSEKGINDRELEAKAIACRIKELMKEQTVFDPTDDDPQRMRPVRYSDIVILLRSAKGWDEKFRKVLSDEGIPVHVMSQTGYFSAYEVSVLLDYLAVLDNPLQDIPMAAVLRSYFGCFDDEELALIRKCYPSDCLYGSLRTCAETGEGKKCDPMHEETCKKAAGFIDVFDSYRKLQGYTPVYDILLEIIDEGYGAYVRALPYGERKYANLNMLLKKAADYGKTSYKGLFHFVKYIEMLRKYEVDFGEANLLDENDDTVRIMTIHKSKGLEFPVCFLAGLHKKYNFMDARAAVIPDTDIGLGVEFTDPVKRIRKTTLVKQAAAGKKQQEVFAEEERVLYVAMTRAKEKLIMTAVVNDLNEAVSRNKSVIKCTCYLDLVLNGLNNYGLPSVSVCTVDAVSLIDSQIKESVHAEAVKEEFMKVCDLSEDDADTGKFSEAVKMLKQRFAFVYPHKSSGNKFEKISVTELKRRSMLAETEDIELPVQIGELYAKEADTVSPYIPDFILEQDREIPAALHGTAVHRIFELWDYGRGTTDEEIISFIDYVRKEGLMTDEMADCVGIGEVSDFVNGALALRMKRADECGHLYREQPFIFKDEDMLIQGIIDAWFLEDDEIVIVDYKTDRVDDVTELVDRYHVQLEYYARALSSMIDKPVRELIIYSTRFKNTVNVPYVVVN